VSEVGESDLRDAVLDAAFCAVGKVGLQSIRPIGKSDANSVGAAGAKIKR